MTKFHENWTKHVTFRVLTSFYYSNMRKYAPPPFFINREVPDFRTINVASRNNWQLCFSSNRNHFRTLRRYHYLLTKFYDDWKINVTSRLFTRFYNSHMRKNSLPSGCHVFQPTRIIFELVQDII
ncbi:hypothetical protein DPMN_117073 [Dreissena polymorpha]|uniref:Uncharacterized protein n=1 Tax=Dreissena polymorpha TaxID=45954 RepID=A0A9D4KQK7_DREPO|nr:hypothetical protein DPMN_117073 [Dreissena polymorpha]